MKRREPTGSFEQISSWPVFNDHAVIHDQDPIGDGDGRQPVGDDDGRATLQKLLQCALNQPLTGNVERRRGLIEN